MQVILLQKNAHKSLREIAKEFGKPITHGDIQRILKGQFPHDLAKRAALGVAPVCDECGRPMPKPSRHVALWVRQATETLARLEQPLPRAYTRAGKKVR